MEIDKNGSAEKETARIEAFSDGVFAIAITLLVLDIKAPPSVDKDSAAQFLTSLAREWPTYLAYVTSFVTILIMWINHHKMFTCIRHIDHAMLILNGLLLMGITLTPFPTALLAEHITHKDASGAAAVYSALFVWIAVFYNLLWRHAAKNKELLSSDISTLQVQSITNQYRFGPLLYFVCLAAAFVSAQASFGLCMLLALYFALPSSKI